MISANRILFLNTFINITTSKDSDIDVKYSESPDFTSSAWLKGWKMIYCYPTLKVLKHEYRIAWNAINFPASCMCSSTIKRFAKETFLLTLLRITTEMG